MAVIKCVCGQQLSGADDDALFAALRTHSDEAHADLAITDEQLRQVLAARSRMSDWDGTRTLLGTRPVVRSITADSADDFLRFFDRDAFMDNPMWAGCYCMFYRFGGGAEEWERRTATENRNEHQALIRRGDGNGLLAYVNDTPVAWCHAGPRSQLPGLDRSEEFRTDDPERVGAIVCFVVAAPYRGQGVAAQLLEAACDHLRERGLSLAEAYPPKDAASDARAYHGPLRMYLTAGFTQHRESEHYVVVRRAL